MVLPVLWYIVQLHYAYMKQVTTRSCRGHCFKELLSSIYTILYIKLQNLISSLNQKICFITSEYNHRQHPNDISSVISLFQHILCIICRWAHLSSCPYIYFTVTELWYRRRNRYCNYVTYQGEQMTIKVYLLCFWFLNECVTQSTGRDQLF